MKNHILEQTAKPWFKYYFQKEKKKIFQKAFEPAHWGRIKMHQKF